MLYTMGGEKGGTGKTALSTNLAVCLLTRGRDVLLVDADTQRSSAKWAAKRSQLPNSSAFVRVPWVELRGEIYDALMDLKARYQDVVVDVGGTDTPELRYAAAAADVLYSPMAASECDLETASEINELVKLVRGMGNPALQAKFILNLCETHVNDDELVEAREVLGDFSAVQLSPIHIARRKPIRTAYKSKLAVTEMPLSPDRKTRESARKAAAEIWAFYEEITGDTRPEE